MPEERYHQDQNQQHAGRDAQPNFLGGGYALVVAANRPHCYLLPAPPSLAALSTGFFLGLDPLGVRLDGSGGDPRTLNRVGIDLL